MNPVIQDRNPLDDATVAYVVETRRYFEDLRQVESQLAGLLVLEAAGARSGLPEHPMLRAAEQLYREAAEGIQRVRVTERARLHHYHLLAAARALDRALAAAHEGLAIDSILAPLRTAYTSLQSAAAELPGFAMVAFEQGCCGVTLRSH